MIPILEALLKYLGSPAFAESIASGVAGNAAYDSLKPAIEKLKSRLVGMPVSEDNQQAVLEEILIELSAITNVNIDRLRDDVLAAIGQGSRPIPRQLTAYAPIDPNEECIGREADLSTLAHALLRSPRVVVVNGLGGIGKTTLAKTWLQAASAEYDHFAWIELSAGDDRVSSSFVETVAYHPQLISALGLVLGEKEPPAARFQAVMLALRQLEGRNLLVVDNAGADLESREIRALLPLPPQWKVLVTSREKLNGYELIPLDRLAPEHAAELFRKHYDGPCTDAELEALLTEVDYHTLTVELLAKTLRHHLGSLSLGDLRAKLRRRELADAELQRRIRSNHSDEETEIYLHLLATFDCAGLDADERLLLARFAALPPGNACTAAQLEDRGFLDAAAEAGAARRALHETLLRLDRKGWLTRHADHRFSLHRMIRQAVLYQLSPGLAELGGLVAAFTQKLKFDTSTNFTLLFQWIPFAEGVLAILPDAEHGHESVGALMNNLGIVCLNLGQYEKARDLLEAALESDLKNFGPLHPNVAVRQSNLANVYRNLGQYEKARDLLEAAPESAVKNFGPLHPNVAVSQSNLANVYSDLGQYEKARDLLEAALESDLKNFGPLHPNVAVSQSNLANVYRNLGQYEKARDLLEAALESDLKNFGPLHPNVAVSQSNLANVYRNLGQYEKARDLLEAALESAVNNFGPLHPNVAVRQSNLANVYRNLGQYEKARDLLEAALESAVNNLGPLHPNVAVSQSNLANVYYDLGQYEKARDLLEAALESDLNNFGPLHPNVAIRQSNLANVYRNLGQYEKACDLLEAALESAVNNFGPLHPNVAVSQSNLANVYYDLGQYEKARDLLEAALESDLNNFEPLHPNVAVSQSNLANVYRNLGQYEKARDLLEAALESDLKNFEPLHPNVAVSQINLGAVYAATGEKQAAKQLFRQAYELFKNHLGEQHPNTQTAKAWLDSV